MNDVRKQKGSINNFYVAWFVTDSSTVIRYWFSMIRQKFVTGNEAILY